MKERPPFVLLKDRLSTELLDVTYTLELSVFAVDAVGGGGVQAERGEEDVRFSSGVPS